MKKFSLNGIWKLTGGEYSTEGKIPGSVYSILLNNGLMEDPFYRDNEINALKIMDNEFIFSKKFEYKKNAKKILLVCEGIDTICDIYLNEKKVAHTENMHRTYSFDVADILKEGENEIKLVFPSLDKYIKAEDEGKDIRNWSPATMKGFMHVRKAHCMLGWDWGIRLPDAGIWRDIYLMDADKPYITDVRITQKHEKGSVFLTTTVTTSKDCDIKIVVNDPDGKVIEIENEKETKIQEPKLWWPHGYGKQCLYRVIVQAIKDGKVIDENEKKIGLRTLKLIREKDEWGEGFCHEINGIRIFAMGADYIPEDNILSRCSKERTEKLLRAGIDANFNAIRVWGGGYYPENYFFDLCDELGLIVFFDCMFACAAYPFGEKFTENVSAEIYDNFKRIRHHACMGVISGNNEIEEFAVYWTDELKKEYIKMFERTIPNILEEICPEIPYVPSSPSSFGGISEPTNENYGDSHYWMVWQGNLPFTEYRNHYFRYLSEFGFQSFPTIKTIEGFTLPEDRNPFSRVMELHQRTPGGNGKILNYLSQTYLYPTKFETLVYASELLQAEAMKYGVEHLRRNRGRCMGTLYWQLNDIWPVASWASIDSNGRYKALHYEAKRFFEPVHISCEETGEYSVRKDVMDERIIGYETKAKLFVNNETLKDVSGIVEWKLCSVDGTIIEEGKEELFIKALSVAQLKEIDFNKTDVRKNYLYYAFRVNEEIISSGTVLFTKPKHFDFIDPKLAVEQKGDELVVTSSAYAKYVEIYDDTGDLVLSNNFFDMNKGEVKVKILSGEPKGLKVRSVFDIK